MSSTPPARIPKYRLDQDSDSDEDAKVARVWSHVHPQATTSPKNTKKTTSDLLADQIRNDKLEITKNIRDLCLIYTAKRRSLARSLR